MSGKQDITRNQARLIRALLELPRVEDAASQVGVSTRTAYRWMSDPVFGAALRRAETGAVGDAVRALLSDMQDNHDVMRDVRDHPRSSPAVRLRAALTLDNSLLKWRQLQDLETIIDDLGRRVDELETKQIDEEN